MSIIASAETWTFGMSKCFKNSNSRRFDVAYFRYLFIPIFFFFEIARFLFERGTTTARGLRERETFRYRNPPLERIWKQNDYLKWKSRNVRKLRVCDAFLIKSPTRSDGTTKIFSRLGTRDRWPWAMRSHDIRNSPHHLT